MFHQHFQGQKCWGSWANMVKGPLKGLESKWKFNILSFMTPGKTPLADDDLGMWLNTPEQLLNGPFVERCGAFSQLLFPRSWMNLNLVLCDRILLFKTISTISHICNPFHSLMKTVKCSWTFKKVSKFTLIKIIFSLVID